MRFIILGFIALISLTACWESEAKDNVVAISAEKKSYKATTVDECIQEKECIWYAFTRQLGLVDYKGRHRENVNLNKWEGSLSFFIEGGEPRHTSNIYKASKILGEYFPDKISESENANHLIFFTRDVEKTYLLNKQKAKELNSGREHVNDMFVQTRGVYQCFSETIENKISRDILKVLTVIDVSSPDAGYCAKISFYNSLGFIGNAGSYHPFSIFSNKAGEYTDLDIFLLHLLYHPKFKSGQDLAQTKNIFDHVFEESKKNFIHKLNKRQ